LHQAGEIEWSDPALRELLQEGWVERKQGYGWAFLPVVNSLHSSAQSYRFRQTIECAALLDEEYEPDTKILIQLRNEQERLLDGMLYRLDNTAIFQIGSSFHESIAGFCKNPFYFDSLVRVNKLRKVYEKHSRIEIANFEKNCREHIELTELLEKDDRIAASTLLRQHLGNVLTMKVEF
jgi:DNA-binding GntR family transcriptional regulator